jgi:DNA-binding beta-propeller fold protein YncE
LGIRKSILPIGLAVILVFVMATAPMIVSAPSAFAQISITPGKNVLSIEPKDNFIHKIDPTTGATISSVEITLAGEDVKGGTGIAFNPADGKTYALLKIEGDDRQLTTINLQTGVATLVGESGKLASLTFNSGTLFSVDLDSDELSTISTLDGSVTNLCDLSVGSGTGLAFNPNDGLLWFATSDDFQRIDDFNVVGSCDLTDIGSNLGNPTALVFFNSFLIVDFPNELNSITGAGVETFIANMDDDSRGLTVIPVSAVGGDMIQMETTSILAAGAQYSRLLPS